MVLLQFTPLCKTLFISLKLISSSFTFIYRNLSFLEDVCFIFLARQNCVNKLHSWSISSFVTYVCFFIYNIYITFFFPVQDKAVRHRPVSMHGFSALFSCSAFKQFSPSYHSPCLENALASYCMQ